MSSDTWNQLQAHKRKQESLKERLLKRRKERQGLLDGDVVNVLGSEGLVTSSPSSGRNNDGSYRSFATFVNTLDVKCHSLINCL